MVALKFLLCLTLVGSSLGFDVLDKVVDTVGSVVNKTVDAAGNLVDKKVDLVKDVVDGVVDAAGNVVDAAGNVVEGVVDAAGDVLEGVVDAAGNVVTDVTQLVGTVLDKKVDLTGSLLKKALGLVEKKLGHALSLGDAAGSLAVALLQKKLGLAASLLGSTVDVALQLLDTKLDLATSLLETTAGFAQSLLELEQAKFNAALLFANNIFKAIPDAVALLKDVGETLLRECLAQVESFTAAVAKLFRLGTALDQHRTFVAASPVALTRGISHRAKVLYLTKTFELLNLAKHTVTKLLGKGYGPALECNPKIKCNPASPYRTIDGSCNNLYNPYWGKSLTPFRRWLDPDYADGVAKPRSSPTLPSARVVSQKVHTNSGIFDLENIYTHMMMQWGQFVDHDITRTPSQQPKALWGTPAVCCGVNLFYRPECFPIDLPPGDVSGKDCMEFVRSVQVENYQCNAAPVEQMNEATSYVDASHVYGSTKKDEKELREFSGGRMKYIERHSTQYLPRDTTGTSCNTPRPEPDYCFRAGDQRLNEQPNLQGMHTIFVREHNRIVNILGKRGCGWNDEKLYQEARKIVGAIMQKITYDEYLPLILGQQQMNKYDLNLASDGHTSHYNRRVDGGVWNGFATAAFRMGHSMIRGSVSTISTNYGFVASDKMRYLFGNTSVLLSDPERSIDGYARGLVTDAVQKADRKMSTEVTNNLFKDKEGNFLDLAAINIQRGRDHGLPGYIYYRSFCGARSTPSAFYQLSSTHDQAAINTLQQTYRNVEDIDLFTGALTETPAPGSMLGPTFSCLLGDQFRALKYGDRFWFEENIAGIAFTKEQLAEIRKVTLSRVLCDNTDTTRIQRNAFMRTNAKVDCYSIPSIDLSKWSCPRWSAWGPWGSCSGSGSRRTKTRRRYCRQGNCQGQSNQRTDCRRQCSGWWWRRRCRYV